jgi:hypothetical protein
MQVLRREPADRVADVDQHLVALQRRRRGRNLGQQLLAGLAVHLAVRRGAQEVRGMDHPHVVAHQALRYGQQPPIVPE